MKKTFTLIALTLFSAATFAQGVIDGRLKNLVEHRQGQSLQSKGSTTGSEMISVIGTLNDGAECPTEALTNLGVTIQEQVYCNVIMQVPLCNVMSLEGMKAFKTFYADGESKPMNDESRKASSVVYINGEDEGKWAATGLPDKYTGRGVIIGIIDVGMDYNHAAFKDANGNSRVKMIIDYRTSPNGEAVTDPDEIAALTYDYGGSTTQQGASHGTHTSATAAGTAITAYNASSTKKYELAGMAPEADLVLCGLGAATLSNSKVQHCVKTIFDYADQQDKPCVINMSFGDAADMHDGSHENIPVFNSSTENGTKPGRILVASVANNGGHHSIRQKITNGALKTIFNPETTITYDGNTVNLFSNSIYAYSIDKNTNFKMEYITVDLSTGQEYTLAEKPAYHYDGKTLNFTDSTLQQPALSTSMSNGKYYYELSFADYAYKEPNLALGVKFTGTEGQMLSVFSNSQFPFGQLINTRTDSTVISGFTAGNDDACHNAMTCTPSVISVGAYTSRVGNTDYKLGVNWASSVMPHMKVLGAIPEFSSAGYDDDGTARPTIIAPGNAILSAYNSYDMYNFNFDGKDAATAGDLREQTSYKGQDTNTNIGALYEDSSRKNWYGYMQGTSQAAPAVSGIVSLWLQADPTLTVQEIQDILKETADDASDAEQCSTTTIRAGYGKINALAGLQKVLAATGVRGIQSAGDSDQASEACVRKVLKDGKLIIRKGTRTFNVVGQEY